jgi:hypothetical protein
MYNDKQMIRFFDFSRYHGRSESGSTYIRVNQLIKYWPEAGKYKYGENPDVLIFQKVYMTPDYLFPAHFEGIKILDICDPDWLEDAAIVETCNAMDSVTCPTEALAEFIRQFHKNVVVIPDRFDIALLPPPKTHTKQAKTVVWFGYAHNAELLKPAIPIIESLKLKLLIISDDDPIAHRWGLSNYQEYYTFVKYNEETIYTELQKADFAILPDGFRPQDRFKSNNKTIKANLAGLPVAKTADEVNAYVSPKERRKWFEQSYDTIKGEYDVRKSVDDYKGIIDGINRRKT